MMNSTQLLSQSDFLSYVGTMLEKYDSKDVCSPGLLEVTGVNQHGMATASGLNDYDYQHLSSLSLGHSQLNQVNTINKIPIPSEILEHFKHIKCHCMMGLFPEIGRAWLTIDSEIYIWTYEQARDVAYYDGLNHLIISVGLVTPKPGVFIEDVKYLLVITTPTEIVVLGVTFGDTTKTISSPIRNMPGTATFEEMQLMNKPIFILNTDNVPINVVKGSDNGRIFLGARNGCLYEIFYQAESSWFGKRCKKVNHSQGIVSYMVPNFLKVFVENDAIIKIEIDNTRQLLYVLTEKGSIEAWDMGNDCNTMHRISKLSQHEIAESAGNIIKTIDPSVFRPIKSICALTVDDCAGLHLIAVTQCGVRIFFSTNPLQPTLHFQQPPLQAMPGEQVSKPQGLYLMHVRLPPGYTPNTTSNKPKQVHTAHYNDGTLLLVSTPQQDQDILWSISSLPFPNRPYLAESTTVVPLDGIVWTLAEIKDRNKSKLNFILRNAQTPKKVVLLTNQGAHIIAILKPADILKQILIACQGPHHEAVKTFFKAQSENEACAISLLIACSGQYRGTDLSMWAAQAFMLYGGEPGVKHSAVMQHRNTSALPFASDRNSPQMFMSTPMSSRLNNSLQHTMQPQHPLSPIGGPSTFDVSLQQTMSEFPMMTYSAKHDGLYLYIARLLRPIWKKRCVNCNLCSTLSISDCNIILEDLYAIKAFLEANSVNELSNPIRSNLTPSFEQICQTSNNNEQKNTMEQVHAEEKRSLTALNYFIKHACEVIAMWKILCEHHFQILVSRLSKEQQNNLATCTFRDLTLSRADTCSFLIVGLINSYLNDNASVSSISSKLREVCPKLFRHEDAVSFKATEILMSSKNCTNEERNDKLRTALQLCKDAAPNLPIQQICQQFTLSGFYEGVIELAATCAAKIDPEEFAIHYYNTDEPVDDREGLAAYASRMNCYKEVKQMLDYVYQSFCNSTATTDLTRYPCITGDATENNVSKHIMEVVKMTRQINDILLHVCIYEWLLEHDMNSELLDISDKMLGEFLRRSVVRHPEDLNLIDLLWKYYEKEGYHSSAAKILDNLAMMPGETISLQQRIEFLARAVMCMRNDSVGFSMTNGILLRDLEDKLEIARVQKVVLNAVVILAEVNPNALTAVRDLNNNLFDITQLYEKFAEPFELWECKLTILNCSLHNDPLLIESVWGKILEQAVEGPGSPQEKCTRLLSKVQTLVKEFGESGHYFPLAFLVRELEIKACRLRLSEGTIPDALVGMNLDPELLMDYYARMISMNERIWANEGNEWHLVQSSIRIVSLLANNSASILMRNKRRVLAKGLDIISGCLNLCYPKPGTDRLQQSLRELQIRLQKLA